MGMLNHGQEEWDKLILINGGFMKDNISKSRIKILEKLFENGYDSEDKISKMKIEDLLKNRSFTRTDLEVALIIKESVLNKKIISFLSGMEEKNI